MLSKVASRTRLRRLITSLYSAFICSAVFTEPTLRPSFPPFSIYRFLPDCNRNEILSRSNCAQVESMAIIIGAKRDGLPSSSNNVSCSVDEHTASSTVALLKLLHDLPHALHSLGLVSHGQSIDDACAHDRSAGAFSVAHARRETVARVLDGLFVQSCRVAVGAEYGLCAVVRAAAFLLRCQFLSTFHCSCLS